MYNSYNLQYNDRHHKKNIKVEAITSYCNNVNKHA